MLCCFPDLPFVDSIRIFSIIILACMIPSSFAEDYTVSITTVEVWVKATDKKGDPVVGLSKEDFQVFENGINMEITCFEEVSFSGDAIHAVPKVLDSGRTGPPNSDSARTQRQFVIFLDLFNTSQAEYLFIRPKIQEFLSQIAATNRSVMLAVLLSSGRLGIAIPFTKDYSKISSKLALYRGNAQRDMRFADRKRRISEALKGGSIPMGVPDERMIHDAYSVARSLAREEKRDSEFSLSALESMGNYVAERSKVSHSVILFVSGGINSDPGRTYYKMVDQMVERLALNLDSTDWALRMPSSIREDNYDILGEVRNRIGTLNRQNITVYCINTRGMVDPDAGNIYESQHLYVFNDTSIVVDYQDSMDRIANETGGISFRNSLNFQQGFDLVLKDMNHQYLLCYNAPIHEKNGKYHNIEVRSHVPETVLRHRSGYLD